LHHNTEEMALSRLCSFQCDGPRSLFTVTVCARKIYCKLFFTNTVTWNSVASI